MNYSIRELKTRLYDYYNICSQFITDYIYLKNDSKDQRQLQTAIVGLYKAYSENSEDAVSADKIKFLDAFLQEYAVPYKNGSERLLRFDCGISPVERFKFKKLSYIIQENFEMLYEQEIRDIIKYKDGLTKNLVWLGKKIENEKRIEQKNTQLEKKASTKARENLLKTVSKTGKF